MSEAIQSVPTETNEETGRKAGRPRSESSKRAILEATRRLLTHTSVQKLSIEAIAKKAGVGKTTIYRWWPNKTAVIVDAVFSQPAFHNILPTPNSATDGIRAQIEKLGRQLSGKNGRVVAEILGDSQAEPEALRIFIETFLQDRYNSLSSLLEAGKQNGEFAVDLDTETAIDVILGPIFFRLISGQVIDDTVTHQVTQLLLKTLR
ncbi:MAG: TetR/AcrR family transcriptional regulator [Alphaproteobacteria bacterium]|nr:TetR/AcrR family transcriptional regulator [Alphaproteobacteria bacterium]